jgi:hypothetical protein
MLGTHRVIAPSETTWLAMAADSGHWNSNKRVPRSHSLNVRDTIPKTAWDSFGGVKILHEHDIIICEETTSECFLYANPLKALLLR